jgi:hypothetical protein
MHSTNANTNIRRYKNQKNPKKKAGQFQDRRVESESSKTKNLGV